MKLCLAVLIALGSLTLALGVGAPSRAAVVALDLEQLTTGSELCVRGRVIDASSAWTTDGAMIWTTYEIEILETLKGVPAAKVSVKVPGGDLDGVRIRNGEAPEYRLGEEVVAFLKHDEVTGGYLTYGWFQGKFTLLDGRVRELQDVKFQDMRTAILAVVR